MSLEQIFGARASAAAFVSLNLKELDIDCELKFKKRTCYEKIETNEKDLRLIPQYEKSPQEKRLLHID